MLPIIYEKLAQTYYHYKRYVLFCALLGAGRPSLHCSWVLSFGTGMKVIEERKPGNEASPPTVSSLVSRNLVVCGRRTTVRLEDEMWASFKNIAESEECSVNDLAGRIDSRKKAGQSFTSAIRLFLMLYYRDEPGHRDGPENGAFYADAKGKLGAGT
jgi:predicted DNA-binding ribbon-helix-helix protein